jgi:hypothetical protein
MELGMKESLIPSEWHLCCTSDLLCWVIMNLSLSPFSLNYFVKCVFVLKVEGPKSPEEMLNILQRVVEECAPTLVASRIEAEERRNNQRLRDEQDAAYRAALEADQVFLVLCRLFFVSAIFCVYRAAFVSVLFFFFEKKRHRARFISLK